MTTYSLIADDDPHIRDVIGFALEKAGMQLSMAEDGRQALELARKQTADLIVLDINMPELDGLEVCREIRKFSDVPILFLSSRDDEIDRILGLEIGGDDYVTKPFSPRELVARINVILKRTQNVPRVIEPIVSEVRHGHLSIQPEQHQASWQGQEVSLTATEFAMLQMFSRQPSRVFSREHIMDHAYEGNVYVSDRTIDSHIRHIRQKFAEVGCENIIETVHGVGYKLSTCR